MYTVSVIHAWGYITLQSTLHSLHAYNVLLVITIKFPRPAMCFKDTLRQHNSFHSMALSACMRCTNVGL